MRSSEWFAGDDEVAVAHRVALRSSGLDIQPNDPRPIIGIADSSSDLNPCNLPLRALAETVSAGVKAAGGIPVVFSVMSMGEDLMKPSALLYRNLLAMEVEEYIRSYPIDGVVLLANCDKSVPGALMGAISTDVPTLVLTGGARPIARFRGKRVGTGTDLWRAWEQHRTGEMSDEDWAEFEACLNCGQGACNTMGTASSMAITAETLGMCLPGVRQFRLIIQIASRWHSRQVNGSSQWSTRIFVRRRSSPMPPSRTPFGCSAHVVAPPMRSCICWQSPVVRLLI